MLPASSQAPPTTAQAPPPAERPQENGTSEPPVSPPESSAKGGKGKEKGGSKGKKGGGGSGGGASGNVAVDVSRLDFKIGRILSVEQHPDADSLYVEQSECFHLVAVWYTHSVSSTRENVYTDGTRK